MSRFFGSALAAVCVPGFLYAQAVLTFNGANGGNWFASNAWLNESGAPCDWQDGSIAVMTNKGPDLTSSASVYGLRAHLTQYTRFSGSGRLTVGAGGILKTGGGEMNIQFAGGLHLAVSQPWLAPDGGLICLDGLKPLTAADGAVLTGGGRASLRMNAGGGLGPTNTIWVTDNAYLSISSGGSLGAPVIVLDGPGKRLEADAGFVFNAPRLCSRLVLRNAASINGGACTYGLGKLEADAPGFSTQVVSTVSFSSWALSVAETECAVAAPAALLLSTPLNNASGVTAALRKTGDGMLVLNAAGAFTGGVAVDAGWVRLAQAGGAGSGAVALSPSSVLEITAAGTVANAVSGGGRVVKAGSGTLTLAGANSYAGGTSLSGGVTRVSAPSALGGGAVVLSPGAALVLTASQTVSGTDVARIAGAGTVLAGTGAEVVWSGDYATGGSVVLDAELGGTLQVGQLTGTGFTKTGPGTLRVAGTSGYSGAIVVAAGVLDIGSTANLAAGVTVQTAGSGLVQLDTLDGQDLGKITGTRAVALKNGASVALDTDALTVTLTTVTNEAWTISGLTGGADLVKTGAGTLVVSNATAFAGRVRVLQGLLRAVGALGANEAVVSNGVFAAYGAGTVLQNTFTVAGGTLLADNGGSLGSCAVSLLAGGTLAATNSGSLGSGPLAVTAGTLRMDAGGTAGTRALTLSGGGQIQIYDGAGFDAASLAIGGGTLDFRATTTMGRGVTLTANTTFSATTPAGALAPTVGTLAGFITTSARSKLNVNGNGQLRLAGGGSFIAGGEIFVTGGGDLTIVSNEVSVTGYAGLESGGKRFAVADGGTFSMTGSGVNLHAGMGGGDCTFEVTTGGVYNVSSGASVLIGNGGNTLFRVRGGTVNVANGGQFLLGTQSATSTGIVELAAGGVLKTSRQIKTTLGTGVLLFTGGALQSDGVNSYDPWIATNIAVSVGAAGGLLDTLGLDLTLGSAGLSGSGLLTQTGGGLLRFTQPSTNWSGGLTLVAGTALAAAHSALGSGTVTLGTNTLRIDGSYLLPNTLAVPAAGGAVEVEAGVTGAVATVSGGRLVKRGGGVLAVDDATDNSGFAIQGGQVAVMPLQGVARAPSGAPAIWVDAASAASFVTATSNDVSRWYDRRTPGSASGFFATNLYNRPMIVSNALNGLPVLDFGRLGQGGGSGDNRMLVFKSYQTNIRSVFWVVGSQNGGGFLLGDSQSSGSARHFHRSSGSGTYGGVASDPLWGGVGQDKGLVRGGETWTNGAAVNGASTGLSGGYDLVSWRLAAADDATNGAPGAVWFASCYAPTDGRLNGGQRLAEVLIYTNRLTEAERLATERYLTRKWFPERKTAGLALGTVSLDGAGAGFINAYAGPVHIAHVVVNAADVSVTGVAGGTAADRLTVTAAGVLDASRLAALAVGELVLEEGATLAAVFDAAGAAAELHVAGGATLPAAAQYTVRLAGTALPPGRAVLVASGGAMLEPSGATVWTHAGAVSRASRVVVDAAAREILLLTPRGTLIQVK
jgi:autotransporter-associated beta strand protein